MIDHQSSKLEFHTFRRSLGELQKDRTVFIMHAAIDKCIQEFCSGCQNSHTNTEGQMPSSRESRPSLTVLDPAPMCLKTRLSASPRLMIIHEPGIFRPATDRPAILDVRGSCRWWDD